MISQRPTSKTPTGSVSGKPLTPRRAAGCLAAAVALTLLPGALRPASAQTFIDLHDFSAVPGEGQTPWSGLARDSAGNLYGTTLSGGTVGSGTVFKLDPSGKETILHSFTGNGGDGVLPFAGVTLDSAGNVYGTTYSGGTEGWGTVFKIDASGNYSVLYSFTGSGVDGEGPYGGVIVDSAGNVYGTTEYDGLGGQGIVFKLDPSGNESVLYSFSGLNGDGDTPDGGLVRDSAGNLYGTTFLGGLGGGGIVFEIDTSGNETVLHNFAGPDGAHPKAGLVRDSAGNLYGTTSTGGSANDGTVFKLDASGNETVLHSFNGSDGDWVGAAVTLDAAGNLYGTTVLGGTNNMGTIFKLDSSGNETVLHSFAGSDGERPYGNILLDAAGNLYGTTTYGGSIGYGNVFELVARFPFSAFSARLDVHTGPPPNFDLNAAFTQGLNAPAINPLTQGLTLSIGSYTVTIPGSSFQGSKKGAYTFEGTLNGVALQVKLTQTGTNTYTAQIQGSGSGLAGLSYGPVTLTLGQNTGTTTP
jgi:uncharacterized repeat protein (TIGR03803 family)